MLCGFIKSVKRISILLVFMLALTVIAGCGQETGKTQSKEDALKSLSTLSNEDEAVDKNKESAPASK